jgi:acetyl esterase
MPLDPELAALLAAAPSFDPAQLRTTAVDDYRAALKEGLLAFGPSPEVVASVVDTTMPGPAGQLPLRIYAPAHDAPAGVAVFFHGSGFVTCDLDTHDHECRVLANGAGVIVVSVDYRLAPEHPFPAAIDDGFAALQWVVANATVLGADPDRVAVVGDSAGGNVAAVVAQLARDAGGPAIAFQMLVYPVTDLRGETQSYIDNATGYGLSAEAMRWYVEQYVRSWADVRDPRGSPLLATSFAELPRAFVAVCGYDPLRDEGKQYAYRMRDAGIDVTLARYDDAVHGIFQMSRFTAIGKRMLDECVAALRAAIGTPATAAARAAGG